MSNDTATPPAVLWAQGKGEIFLTFSVECKDPVVKIEKDSVYFKGANVSDNKLHEVTISLHGSVVPETSTHVNKGRCLEMVLRKEKANTGYWPSLTKDKKKPHYLKIDFNKWQDEDDEDPAAAAAEGGNNVDFEQMLRSMGGNYDLSGKGDKPSFDDMESDSDDENLPDLE